MSVLSIIEGVFPPPKYMTLPTIGVDISDTSLKYIQFDRKYARDKNLELRHWGDIEIPAGVLERGNVHDSAKLADVLREMKEVCNAEYVRVSLPEERAYLFESELNYDTPFSEIRGLLEFKLEENVPLSPREVYFDYDIVVRDNRHLHVVVAVYAKETINNYFEACLSAGVMPLSFEIEAQAIARAGIPKEEVGTQMIIDFGKTRMGIGIVHHGTLMYTSTVDVGGLSMSAAMRSVLGDLAESELTKIKNTTGIINSKENTEIFNALKGTLETVREELETRIHYWDTRDGDSKTRKIEKIILCGGSSNLEGFPEYLSRELQIPTERADVWQNAFSIEEFVPPVSRRYSYGYATAIGLGLTSFV